MHSNYSLPPEADEKLGKAMHLIRDYIAAREGLRQLGILRSERAIQSDLAEW